MLEKLSERVSKINKISRYILKYGLSVSLVLFMITVYLMGEAKYLSDIFMARQIAGVGFYVIIEVVVGAVLFDVCMKNNEE